jgi:hypothetical protein
MHGLYKLGHIDTILFLVVLMMVTHGLHEDNIMFEIVVELYDLVTLLFIVFLIHIHGILLLLDWIEGTEVHYG